MDKPRQRLELGVIIALVWLMVAAAITALYGPRLGLRGWIWLGIHHVVCGVGTSHELLRAWRRRRAAVSAARPEGTEQA